MYNIWDIYTARQEYKPLFYDSYNRFPIVLNTHPLFYPIVSQFLFTNGFYPEYPEKKPFAVCISHDIDYIYLPRVSTSMLIKSFVKSILNCNVSALQTFYYQFLRKKYPHFSIERILKIHQKYQIKSTFFFMALDQEDLDFNYEIDEVSDSIQTLIKEKQEIGLHGGHHAYYNLETLQREKKRIEYIAQQPIIAYRNHYLKFKTPDTWHILSQAGFEYDSTYGFASSIGFRNGMCYPFRPYDRIEMRFIPIYEIPLIIMDETLFNKRYLNLDIDTAFKIIVHIIQEIEKIKGVVTLLWHNSSYTGKYLYLYEKIIGYLKEKDPWFCTGKELLEWWKNRQYDKKIEDILTSQVTK